MAAAPTRKAAQAIERPRAGGVRHGAGSQEEDALRERVAPDVEQGAREGEHGDDGHAAREAEQPEAKAEGDDPGVLDRAVGEDALHVFLGEREEHAEER
jgi:hypothetical protein